jgi:hypothetical protein
MNVADMRINTGVLSTAIALTGGAAIGILSQSHNAPFIAVFVTALLGALGAVLVVHSYMAVLDRIDGPRHLVGRPGLAIVTVTCGAGALPAYWLSNGQAVTTLIGVATLLLPVLIWLARRARLAGTVASAMTLGVATSRVLVPALIAAAIGVPCGLMVWLLPILPVVSFNMPLLIVPAFCLGVPLGCVAASMVGVVVARTSLMTLSRFDSNLNQLRPPVRMLPTVVGSTLLGLVVQCLIFLYLWIDPPSSIQGPGPFMPPFAIAAMAAVAISHRQTSCTQYDDCKDSRT